MAAINTSTQVSGVEMTVELELIFRFEAAHRLPKVPAGHKCGRLHGHSYVVGVVCSGEVEAEFGWLVDFGEVKRILTPVFNTLDHSNLNDILQNPTSELLAAYILDACKTLIPAVTGVWVSETRNSKVRVNAV